MNVCSYTFILMFLPISVLVFWIINKTNGKKVAHVWLIICSLIFIGYKDYRYALVAVVSTYFNWSLGTRLFRKNNRGLLIFGVIADGLLLMLIKIMPIYQNVFEGDRATSFFFFPLGLSYYTFRQIAFLLESNKNNIRTDFWTYCSYICFFPGITCGPILLTDGISQFEYNETKLDYGKMSYGLFLFAIGMSKIILFSNILSVGVDYGYEHVNELSPWSIILVMLGYCFQIYFDFSGCSDMAIGLAKMFDINLPENFNLPYQADGIIDFWSRWHMSLNSFWMKYIYIPLGGNRKGKLRRNINILIVFLVSGIWHGMNITFAIWGIIHGVANIISRNNIVKIKNRMLNKLLLLVYLCLTWSIFRASSIDQVMDVFRGLFGKNNYKEIIDSELIQSFCAPITTYISYWMRQYNEPYMKYIYTILLFLMAMIFIYKEKKIIDEDFNGNKRRWIFVLLIMVYSILSFNSNTKYIYAGF